MNSSVESGICIPFTESFENRLLIKVEDPAVFVFGVFEERSEIDEDWLNIFGEDGVFELRPESDLYSVAIPRFREQSISMRNQVDVGKFIEYLGNRTIYLDITGLPHHIWMPLLRVGIESGAKINCVYVEPKSYTFSPAPKPGEFFNLSDRLHGFQPIPTFARLIARRADELTLVPLLGFEGIRFRHLIERLEPSERNINPVVGVPGFEPEYPFHTFEGNATVLSETRSWQRVGYVDASCPFSLTHHLTRIADQMDGKSLQIATIGTKPHALGAALYAIANPTTEIIYDHPVRKKSRTSGATRCHLYMVSDFLERQSNEA